MNNLQTAALNEVAAFTMGNAGAAHAIPLFQGQEDRLFVLLTCWKCNPKNIAEKEINLTDLPYQTFNLTNIEPKSLIGQVED